MPRKKRGVSLVGIIFIFVAFLVMVMKIQSLNSTNVAFIRNLTDENHVSNTELNSVDESKSKENVMDRYFYNQISDSAKKMYDTIYDNLSVLESGSGTIEFPNNEEIADDCFQSAWDAFKLDHPEIFYVDTSQLSLITQKTSYVFFNKTTYKYSISEKDGGYYIKAFKTKEDFDNAQTAVNSVTNSIKAGAIGSRYNQVKYVHDWIVDHCEYNKADESTNDSIYGVLVKKKAVCEGYANTFKYLMDELNIPCVIVFGEASNSSGETETHAWNYVQMDNGKWYAVDTTWDDPIIYGGGALTNDSKYKYFLVGTDFLEGNHEEDFDVSGTGQDFRYPEIAKENY